MLKKIISVCTAVLFFTLCGQGRAQDSIAHLVRNLLKMGYPLKKEDILALDKIGMRFDSKNRITVLEKILADRDLIHRRQEVDYFTRTGAITDALRLLDELDLPASTALIEKLNRQSGWEAREKTLLAYMAAKRDVQYKTNVAYLLDILPQHGGNLEKIYGKESAGAIIDVMNCLSYLSDLFIYNGDTDILNALIRYGAKTYGFPAEYLSHLFVDMLVMRPAVFVDTLSIKDDHVVHTVINALIFGIRNNQVREKVEEVLRKDLSSAPEPGRRIVMLLTKKITQQSNPAGPKTDQDRTEPPAASGQ